MIPTNSSLSSITNSLCSLGENALVMKLQPINWTDKEGNKQTTFAFSNRKASGTCIVSGEEMKNVSVSVYIPGQDTQASSSSKAIVTVWLNDMEQAEYDTYLDTYGADCIGVLDDDNNCVVMFEDEAQEFLSTLQSKSSSDETVDSVNA